MTLGHPAAVLPLRRLGLPLTALVIGSLVPDLPLYLGWSEGYALFHSPLGVVTVDLLAGMLLMVLWFSLARDALVDLSPSAVRSRLAPRARLAARQWALAPLAVAIGAATHVFWDSFTHPGRWGARHVDWLQSQHEGVLGLKWAQYVSGSVGLLVVTWAIAVYLRDAQVGRESRSPRVLTPLALPGAAVLAFGMGIASSAVDLHSGLEAWAFRATVDSVIAVVLGGLVVCTIWQFVYRRTALNE
jgi:hypothetical protein